MYIALCYDWLSPEQVLSSVLQENRPHCSSMHLLPFTLLPHLFSCFLPTAQHDDFLFRPVILPCMKNSENENELTDLLISVFFSSFSEKRMLSVKESKIMNYTVMGMDSIFFYFLIFSQVVCGGLLKLGKFHCLYIFFNHSLFPFILCEEIIIININKTIIMI